MIRLPVLFVSGTVRISVALPGSQTSRSNKTSGLSLATVTPQPTQPLELDFNPLEIGHQLVGCFVDNLSVVNTIAIVLKFC